MDEYLGPLRQLCTFGAKRGIKLGLKNMEKLSAYFGHPERVFDSVHIAGSNGKGSVATKIACGLQAAGHRVGLYTSPHIHSFCERISIDKKQIEEQTIAYWIPTLFQAAKTLDISPTFFEYTTLLAFLYFRERQVEFAVVETGLGGRLDATNILLPKLSVITSISLEHTEILGKTLTEIAREKQGILKPNVPAVLGPTASLIQAPHTTYLKGPFPNFQEENKAIAKKAMEMLDLPERAIQKGLQASPPCRMEVRKIKEHTFIFDVAHNPSALKALFLSLPNKLYHTIFGMSQEKDLFSSLSIVLQGSQTVHLVDEQERGASTKRLITLCNTLDTKEKEIGSHPSIKHAVRRALSCSRQNPAPILLCGSFYLMSPSKKCIRLLFKNV